MEAEINNIARFEQYSRDPGTYFELQIILNISISQYPNTHKCSEEMQIQNSHHKISRNRRRY
jgi:hypothetical protein